MERLPGVESLQREINTVKIKQFIDFLNSKGYNAEYQPWSYDDFRVEGDDLFLEADGKRYQLTQKSDPSKFYAVSTLQTRGMPPTVFRKYFSTSMITPAQRKAATMLKNSIDNAMRGEEILPGAVEQVESAVQTYITVGDFDGLPDREIRGLSKSMTTYKEELVNNLAKITALDEEIMDRDNQLDFIEDEDEKNHMEASIVQLVEERKLRLETSNRIRDQLRSQVTRIKETLNRMGVATSVREKIAILFREQGVTIFTIITALGFMITAIVEALAPSPGRIPAPAPAPAPPGPGAKDWIKKQLKNFAGVLAKLGDKALVALPGIIGSVVSWLFKTASAAVGYVAGNLWIMLVGVGVILFDYVTTTVKTSKRR